MPYLTRPSLPVSFPLNQAVQFLETEIKAKRWRNFRVASVKLLYVPYYLFSYDAFLEVQEASDSKPAVSDTTRGKLALNAFTNELDAAAAEVFDAVFDRVQQPEKNYPFEVKRAAVDNAQAEKVAQLRVASELRLARENVVISGMEMLYLPVWCVDVEVEQGIFHLEVDAVNGSLLTEEAVPERERGWLEITGETIEDLKKPGAWVNYTATVGGSLAGAAARLTPLKKLKTDRNYQLGFLAVLLALVVYWYLYL